MDAFEELRKAIAFTMQARHDPEALFEEGLCLTGMLGALSRKSRPTQISLLERWKSNGWTQELKKGGKTLLVPTPAYFRMLLPCLAREARSKKQEAMLAKMGLALERRHKPDR